MSKNFLMMQWKRCNKPCFKPISPSKYWFGLKFTALTLWNEVFRDHMLRFEVYSLFSTQFTVVIWYVAIFTVSILCYVSKFTASFLCFVSKFTASSHMYQSLQPVFICCVTKFRASFHMLCNKVDSKFSYAMKQCLQLVFICLLST